MTVSGTTTFNPNGANIVDEAFQNLGLKKEEIVGEHIIAARNSLNYMLCSEWPNREITQWTIDRETFTLVNGQQTYTLATNTIDVMMAVITVDNFDALLTPISRTDYLGIPNKTITGRPQCYFADKQRDNVVMYIWPTSDNTTDTVTYDRIVRINDIGTALNTPDIPIQWLDAMIFGLATRLAVKYRPERHDFLLAKYNQYFEWAKERNEDRADIVIEYDFSTFYR